MSTEIKKKAISVKNCENFCKTHFSKILTNFEYENGKYTIAN